MNMKTEIVFVSVMLIVIASMCCYVINDFAH